ncbi:MAG: thioredoxin-dependent thiol peroxidase [Clostridiales bacterium]|nr:thioredoxin-dependent thiol peroxidase [Clostridiales bacterium]
MLAVGTKAPDFTLLDQDGNEVSLSNFKGQKVIIYFYPKDSTPGCTRQACAFQAAISQYDEKAIKVIGISKDSVKSHKNFATKQGLTFTLVSDPDRVAIEAYDVWQEKKLYGKVSMGVVRTTYLIDENGMIEKVYEKVKPDVNASEILEYLNESKSE